MRGDRFRHGRALAATSREYQRLSSAVNGIVAEPRRSVIGVEMSSPVITELPLRGIREDR